MKILSGKEPAAQIKRNVRYMVHAMETPPVLAIIQVKGDPASDRYVRNKIKDAEEVGIITNLYLFEQDVSQQVLLNTIARLNTDKNINGIIVQLPLPPHLQAGPLLDAITAVKDVDGLGVVAQGMLYTGKKGWAPCTPEGVIRLFDYYKVPIEGKSAVVCGRSALVGAPLAQLLQNRGATVTVYHSKTPQRFMLTDFKYYDIFCFATGRGKAYSRYDFDTLDKDHQIYIADCTTAFDEKGALCGDFDPRDLRESDPINYTPCPGGIGLMTRAVLLENVATAAGVQQTLREGAIKFRKPDARQN